MEPVRGFLAAVSALPILRLLFFAGGPRLSEAAAPADRLDTHLSANTKCISATTAGITPVR